MHKDYRYPLSYPSHQPLGLIPPSFVGGASYSAVAFAQPASKVGDSHTESTKTIAFAIHSVDRTSLFPASPKCLIFRRTFIPGGSYFLINSKQPYSPIPADISRLRSKTDRCRCAKLPPVTREWNHARCKATRPHSIRLANTALITSLAPYPCHARPHQSFQNPNDASGENRFADGIHERLSPSLSTQSHQPIHQWVIYIPYPRRSIARRCIYPMKVTAPQDRRRSLITCPLGLIPILCTEPATAPPLYV